LSVTQPSFRQLPQAHLNSKALADQWTWCRAYRSSKAKSNGEQAAMLGQGKERGKKMYLNGFGFLFFISTNALPPYYITLNSSE